VKLIYKSASYKAMSVLRYFVAVAFHTGKLRVKRLSMIGRRCGIYILGKGSIQCAGRIIVNDDVMLYAKGQLTIGDDFGINSYSRIVAHDSIQIGNNVTIGQSVSILDHDHHYTMESGNLQLDGYDTAPISIGNNVWIGDKSTVLKGVTIGNNVVIGAQTLVNKDVPDNCVVGGTPFRILKEI